MADNKTLLYVGLGLAAYYLLFKPGTVPYTYPLGFVGPVPPTTATNPLASLLQSLLGPAKPATSPSGSGGGGVSAGSGAGSATPGSPGFVGPLTPAQQAAVAAQTP